MNNTAPAILSWDEIDEPTPTVMTTPAPSFGIPADAAQFASMLLLANSVLKNPTLGIVAKYLGKPELLVNGAPNMAVIMSLKTELDALIPTSSNPAAFTRVICNHCNKITTIDQ